MSRLLLAGMLFLCGLSAALAQGDPAPASPADAAAIRAVIEHQLAAFQRDDAAAAFSDASPGIQAKFGTPDIFMDMVRAGYQPVYRPRETEFRELVAGPEGLVQKVLFVGPDGRQVLAMYSMEREDDGSWRISGCVLLEPTDQTT
jgi:uncharacterized protein DUF4864